MTVVVETPLVPPELARQLVGDSEWHCVARPYRCVERYERTFTFRARVEPAHIEEIRCRLAKTSMCSQQGCRHVATRDLVSGEFEVTYQTTIDSSD